MNSNPIHEKALSAAQNFNHAQSVLLEALIEVDRQRTFELFECTHLTPYCVKVLKLDDEMAECLVRIVRRAREVPELARAVIGGEVTLQKAKRIASVITKGNQSEWLAKAKSLSKTQLEREVARVKGQNTQRVTLDLPFEVLDQLKRGQELLASKEQRFVTQEEALAWALRELISRHDPVRRAERARAHSVEHAVTRRDQERCQYRFADGSQCTERKWLDRHHRRPRANGGADTLENLVTLCSGHHRHVHRRRT